MVDQARPLPAVPPRWCGQLAVAAALELLLLAVLRGGTGLGAAGLVAGVVHALVLWAILAVALRRAGRDALGPADLVTLARAVLAGGVTALVAGQSRSGAVLVALAAVALVLDGVDGRVARSTGTVTPEGARFDMEVDAFLILVLSVRAAFVLGVWVLAIGLMRYAYVAAGRVLPWLRGAVPVSYARKVVAAIQGIVLTVACAGVVSTAFLGYAVAVALLLLVWSFGRDVVWLYKRRGNGTDRSRLLGHVPRQGRDPGRLAARARLR
ncbi:CDP-alcohol phosphatidyltransferase family protein [Actinomadura macrotermitis]|uniref:CDP-alcohol phosphatidyltransferase family protein n=1 Tax=Actinomadura macrotermitis TaxID=2585200 RepID=A0A7K0BR13_9ACTN|nr:CDP-alcohol phosphatidyltransferase family protein [Actinomadura macrotermitis]MQY03599.1 hypothetical protein [Actinomadura macrotermitis]